VTSHQIRIEPASLDVSIVIPVYNEELNVEALAGEISGTMRGAGRSWECVWVDDGSTDRTFEKLVGVHDAHPHHEYLQMDSHRGQSAALAAGFSHSRGRYIATLDGDGQSDPADVVRLLTHLVENELDLVNGRRERRRDNLVRKISSRIANTFRNAVTGDRVTDVGCSLRVFRRESVDGLLVFKGMHRFLPTLIKMNGYQRVVELPVRHRPRLYGWTKYGISNRLWVGIADTLAIRWMKHRMTVSRVRASSMDTSFQAGNWPEASYDESRSKGPGERPAPTKMGD